MQIHKLQIKYKAACKWDSCFLNQRLESLQKVLSIEWKELSKNLYMWLWIKKVGVLWIYILIEMFMILRLFLFWYVYFLFSFDVRHFSFIKDPPQWWNILALNDKQVTLWQGLISMKWRNTSKPNCKNEYDLWLRLQLRLWTQWLIHEQVSRDAPIANVSMCLCVLIKQTRNNANILILFLIYLSIIRNLTLSFWKGAVIAMCQLDFHKAEIHPLTRLDMITKMIKPKN